jgi:hypothetical protein
MIYSCFDEKRGVYDYYEDDMRVPANGDLPVPSPPSNAGVVGAPARESGRPLPWGAKPIGSGWHARGMVVNCGNAGLGAIDQTTKLWLLGLGGVVGGFVIIKLFQTYLKYGEERF